MGANIKVSELLDEMIQFFYTDQRTVQCVFHLLALAVQDATVSE